MRLQSPITILATGCMHVHPITGFRVIIAGIGVLVTITSNDCQLKIPQVQVVAQIEAAQEPAASERHTAPQGNVLIDEEIRRTTIDSPGC
jgi:hypothetical protein